jgi:hypothetical protein
MKSNKPEAPSWVLPTLIILLITMQLSVRAEDIKEPKIDTLSVKHWNWLITKIERARLNGMNMMGCSNSQ